MANVVQTLRGAAAATTLNLKRRLISASYDAGVVAGVAVDVAVLHRAHPAAALGLESELGFEFGSQTTFAATASRRADVGRQNKTETGKRQRRRRRRILKSNQ